MTALPAGCSLVLLETVDSTNDHAKDLARNGAPSGTVVRAKAQTAGRGRHGNVWTSIPGNLLMTLILRPRIAAAEAGQLSFIAAVALARTLHPILPPPSRVALKWPNDVLINGKKAAGILLETEANGNAPAGWIVIGIGLNVTAAPEGATCLHACGVTDATAEGMFETVMKHLMNLYTEWQDQGFAPARAEWLRHAGGVGGPITVRLARETMTGTFLGIDEAGALEFETPQGVRRTITSGEVFAA